MPLVKPAPWAVSRAGVDPAFQHLWDGLVFCAPLWEGDGQFVYDIVTGNRGVVLGGASVDWEPTSLGYQAHVHNPDEGAWNFGSHPTYERVPNADGFTAVLLFTPIALDWEACFFGYSSSSVQFDNAAIYTDGAERFRGSVGSSVSANQAGFTVGQQYIGFLRSDFSNMETVIYRDDGSLFGTASAAANQPSTGGEWVLGADQTLTSQGPRNIRLGAHYGFDRELTDSEILQLVGDPFGMIRPADAQLVNPTVSLYATADGTFDGIVNENDEYP